MAFIRLLCSKECLPGLLENSRFPQIRRWNVLVVFLVNGSKVGVAVPSGRFLQRLFRRFRLACNRQSYQTARPNKHMCSLRTASWKTVLSVLQWRLKWGRISLLCWDGLFSGDASSLLPVRASGTFCTPRTFFFLNLFYFYFSNHYKVLCWEKHFDLSSFEFHGKKLSCPFWSTSDFLLLFIRFLSVGSDIVPYNSKLIFNVKIVFFSAWNHEKGMKLYEFATLCFVNKIIFRKSVCYEYDVAL